MMNIVVLILFIIVLRDFILIALSFFPISFLFSKLSTLNREEKQSESDRTSSSGMRNIKLYILGYIRFLIIRVGWIPSHHIRIFLYKYMLKSNLHRKVHIYHGAEIRSPHQLMVGEGSSIGDFAILDARAGIFIGKNVNISSNVSLWTYQHDYNDSLFRCTSDKIGLIEIGDYAWIGPNVVILPNISIGEGAVIAAGAVVTKDVAPYSLVGGVPAKMIGYRNQDLRYQLGEYLPFY